MALTLRRKLAFSALTQAIVFGAAEIALRCAGVGAPAPSASPVEFVGAKLGAEKFPRVWDDELFWRMLPGATVPGTGERINAQGFRGPEFAKEKPAGARRAICLGDSCVFGSAVPDNAPFARRLERWLRDGGARDEVLNLGVPGYSAFQLWRQLDAVGLGLAPDAVIVYPGAWNDFTPAIRCDDRTIAARLAAERESPALAFLGSLRILGAFRSGAPSAPRLSGPGADGRQISLSSTYGDAFALRHETPDGPRVSIDSFRDCLRSISRDAKAAGAKTIFVVPAAPSATRRRFPESEAYAQAVRDVAAACGDGLADARAALARGGDDDAMLFEDGIHPSPCGHSRIAAVVAEELSRLGWPSARAAAPPALADPMPADLSLALRPATPSTSSERIAEHATVNVACPGELRAEGVAIPERAALRVTYGWLGDAAAQPVRFEIRAELDGKTTTILDDELRTPVADESAIARKDVDLSAFAGRTVAFVFATRGGPGKAYWIRPQVGPARIASTAAGSR